jgi:threonine/homoserine/homoserine lactone efflux protein
MPIGPLATICIQRTISKGLRVGFVSAAGIILADSFYIILAAIGYGIIYNFINQHIAPICIGGIFFLIVFGLKLIFHNDKKTDNKETSKTISTIYQSFTSVLLLGLINPFGFIVFSGTFPLLTKNTTTLYPLNIILLTISALLGIIVYWFIILNIINHFKMYIQFNILKSSKKILGSIIIILALVSLVALKFNEII